jgi:Chalcone isomerase-like
MFFLNITSLLLPLLVSSATVAMAQSSIDMPVPSYLEGVHLPSTKEVEGITLFRNGEGVRHFHFLGMSLRIYVAGFWTANRLESLEDVLGCDQPKQMDFTFLRNVGQSRVTAAWQHQLEESVSYRYDGFENDQKDFVNAFGPIENGNTQSVLLIGNETQVIDQGILKVKIIGKNFQRAFLSMWFGERAVTQDLKLGLLGINRSTFHN